MSDPIPAPDPTPPRRISDWPLPPYRFVPGLHPHPFRHADGHMYTDGSPPVEEPWDSSNPWEQDRAWLRGLDLFDHRYYWESHECWEACWHCVPRDSSISLLLQGLIQASAYLLKAHMTHREAAARLRVVSIEKLCVVLAREGSPYRGVALTSFMAEVNDFERTGIWPKLG